MDQELNTKLAHQAIAQKKAILSEYRELYDMDDILSADTWGTEEIAKRAQRLAELAQTKVWRLGPPKSQPTTIPDVDG